MAELKFDPRPLAAEHEIEAIERRIELSLPAGYRRYLLAHNGAAPLLGTDPALGTFVRVRWDGKPAARAGGVALIGDFYSAPKWLEIHEIFRTRIPPETVAIGNDPGGSQFLLVVKGQARGQILFWHRRYAIGEDERDEGKPAGYENVGFIADSFEEFLAKLELEPDDWDVWEAENPAV